LTTQKAVWTYTSDISYGNALDYLYRSFGDSIFFYGNRTYSSYSNANCLTDLSANILHIQVLSSNNSESNGISTPLILNAGNYIVSLVFMHATRMGTVAFTNYINLQVSLGSSSITFNNTTTTPYTTSSNISIIAYNCNMQANGTFTYNTPSTLMTNNSVFKDTYTVVSSTLYNPIFVTILFSNIPAGTNTLSIRGIGNGEGYAISQISCVYGPPPGYLYYFKFRGDAVNYGSLSSSVPIALFSGSTPNANGTIGSKTCLTITTTTDYVYFPAFGSTATTAPPTNFSFGFWVYSATLTTNNTANSTDSIANLTFSNNTIWQNYFQKDSTIDNYLFAVIDTTTVGTWDATLNKYYQSSNTWIHLFYTFNSGTITGYVNGVVPTTGISGFNATSTGATTFPTLSSYYHILGRKGDGGSGGFIDCGMREFLYYNRSLTATEVYSIYKVTDYS
jgi:hypothetical protein